MRRLLTATAVLLTTAAVVWSCVGGGGPESELMRGDKGVLLPFRSTYRADFEAVFGRRINDDAEPVRRGLGRDEVLREVLALLDARLRAQNQADRATTIKIISDYLFVAEDRESLLPVFRDTVQKLPAEFREYLTSVTFTYPKSVEACDRLLALPPEERRTLTALAHYRRARVLMTEGDWAVLPDAEVRRRLAIVRADLVAAPAAVKAGAADVGQLSLSCEAWHAYTRSMILPSCRLIELGEADYGGALRTYLAMPPRGDANGRTSAYQLIRKLASESNFAVCTQDPDLRRLMTLYLCSGGIESDEHWLAGDDLVQHAGAWLQALDLAKVEPGFDATRIAMLRYQAGDWIGCEAALRLAPADEPVAVLLRSRLILRAGGDATAAAAVLRPLAARDNEPHLGRFVDSYVNESDDRQNPYVTNLSQPGQLVAKARSELATLLLAKGQAGEALTFFVRANRMEDANYVAECVLSIDELRVVIDRDWPSGRPQPPESYEPHPATQVRLILAQRLFRAGRWAEARPYFPEEEHAAIDEYEVLRKLAGDEAQPARERADAFWRAALLVRKHGETWLHCGFGPSWTSSADEKGRQTLWYQPDQLPKHRFTPWVKDAEAKLVAAGPEETARVRAWTAANLVTPDRAHRDARYETFRLALRAAQLLPDNDPAGAKILQYAGNLLKYREPAAAVPAYRELALRFRATPYGKHAWDKHWFSAERPEPDAGWLR